MPDAVEIQLSLRDPDTWNDRDFVLRTNLNTSMSEVLDALGQVRPGPYFVGEQELTPEGTFSHSPLVEGAIIGAGRVIETPPPAELELAVVGGPAAGTRIPLWGSAVTIGRDDRSDLVVADRLLASVHMRVSFGKDIFWLENYRRPQSVLVEGKPVNEWREIAVGDQFRAGASLFELRRPTRSDADLSYDGEGHIVFNRPGRIQTAREEPPVRVPRKPQPLQKQRIPWLIMLAPAAIAILVVLFFPQFWYFLIFALLTPVMMLSSTMGTRRADKDRKKEEDKEYEAGMRELKVQVRRLAEAQGRAVRFRSPHVVDVQEVATLRRRRLWERRSDDRDFLLLRVGSANRRATISYTSNMGEDAPEPPRIFNHPVAVDLRQAGVMGVAGDVDDARAVVRNLVVQMAVLQNPNDLRIALLGDSEDADHWSWMRWLPHTLENYERGAPYRAVALNQWEREQQVKSLLKVLVEREEAERDAPPGTPIVIVWDGMRVYRDIAGAVRLLHDGPRHNIFSIGIDSEGARLAKETQAEVTLDSHAPGTGRLRMTGRPLIDRMVIDGITEWQATEAARGIAPLIEISHFEGGMASLPNEARLIDLLAIDMEHPEHVVERWRQNGRTTEFAIGAGIDGVARFDLKYDGPHGLVAGTTGSGKSEFLQTLVVSLAYENRPDSVNFLLVDYKGASAFSSCEKLPHTVGMVTNLDEHLTKRALTALDAELQRRERILGELEASDLDIAWQHDANRAAEQGLARLVLVIDEFAELKNELPDFVDGLVRVARVGRSLGVHLILGTQRPSGVVTSEMRANTGLRVGLRMEDKGDSSEVLDQNDAANISRATPGRAYARLGGAGALVPFQTARVAGRRRDVVVETQPPEVIPMPWDRVGRALPLRREEDWVESDTTDLYGMVEMLNKAADMLGAPNPRSPWLPPLATNIVIDVLQQQPGDPVVYALEDIPKLQEQRPVVFDVEHGSHLLLAGAARTGRSSALRMMAASLATTWSPSDLHMYAMDFGNGALVGLEQIPNFGAATSRSQTDRIERLVEFLAEEVTRRQEVLSYAGVGDLSELRRTAEESERLPYLVLLVDRWEGLLSEFPMERGSEVPDLVLHLLREGPSVGLRIVITGDRGVLTDRITTQVEAKMLLRMNSKEDFGFVSISARSVPDEMPPGRALRADTQTDVQFGLLASDPSARAQNEMVERIAEESKVRFPNIVHKPVRLDVLPGKFSLEETRALPGYGAVTSPTSILAGIGGNTLDAIRLDAIDDGPWVTIAGPSRTGRSTAAKVMAMTALEAGATVITVTPRPSPLSELAAHPKLTNLSGKADDMEPFAQAANAADGQVLVVVDDSDTIADSPVSELIRTAVKENHGEMAVVAVGGYDDLRSAIFGLAKEARRARVGLLFSPTSPMDGDIVGGRLPRNTVGRRPPGRAVLVRHGAVDMVQVPLP